jgi:hypothetical protein
MKKAFTSSTNSPAGSTNTTRKWAASTSMKWSRDVNHPSIIIWDNGNEGGWNTNLDADFGQLDPQHRAVNHPWAKFGELMTSITRITTRFVKAFRATWFICPRNFSMAFTTAARAGTGRLLERDARSKVSAGRFLWVFADEGVQRNDLRTTRWT